MCPYDRKNYQTKQTETWGLPLSSIRAALLRNPLMSVPLLALAFSSAMPVSVSAQDNGSRPTVSGKKPPAASSTISLVNLLVQQGIIKEEQAAALIKQAEDESYVTREAARDASVKADEATKAATAAAAAATPPGSKRVTYVPEIVKRQLREDLRKEVMAQARTEGWASPGKYPEWASRIRFSGDIRGRFDGIWHPRGYSSTANIFDYNALNTGAPYDISAISNPNQFAPLYNTTQNRNRSRLRARLAMDADLYEGFTAGIRIASGSDNSPVSTNQTLGASGGNFSKYQLWLDRGFLKFEPFKNPALEGLGHPSSLVVSAGRFDNPFWSPTDLVWGSELGFDGVAIQAAYEVLPGATPFLVAGAFPIFNTNFDFATREPVKFKSQDKYLFGGQLGLNWKVNPEINFGFGAALYDFQNVQGRRSSPCNLSIVEDCDTDALRPSFAQKGNTYMPLRDIVPNIENNFGRNNQFQYFGLASGFRPVTLSGRLEFNHFNPVSVRLDGEFVWNIAFNRSRLETLAVNNRGPDSAGRFDGQYNGGNKGWLTRISVGHNQLNEFGKWNVHVGYKYLESDATLDAFVDPSFGLGGTNLKGYFVGSSVALSHSVTASAKWMSANAIAGAPYAVDMLQIDLNGKF